MTVLKPEHLYTIRRKNKCSKAIKMIYKKFCIESLQHVFTIDNKCFTINYKNRYKYSIRRAL